MYGGDERNDEAAIKAAGNERRGLMAYFQTNTAGKCIFILSI